MACIMTSLTCKLTRSYMYFQTALGKWDLDVEPKA